MKELLSLADIITPNITEACLLADIPYRESGWTAEELTALADRLHTMGPDRIVITGMQEQEDFINFISCNSGAAAADENAAKAGRFHSCCRMHAAGESRPGTGDIFASIIAAEMCIRDSPEGIVQMKASDQQKIRNQASSEKHGEHNKRYIYFLEFKIRPAQPVGYQAGKQHAGHGSHRTLRHGNCKCSDNASVPEYGLEIIQRDVYKRQPASFQVPLQVWIR